MNLLTQINEYLDLVLDIVVKPIKGYLFNVSQRHSDLRVIIKSLVEFDILLIKVKGITEDSLFLSMCKVFNGIYRLANEWESLDFIELPPFDDSKVDAVTKIDKYMVSRYARLKDWVNNN